MAIPHILFFAPHRSCLAETTAQLCTAVESAGVTYSGSLYGLREGAGGLEVTEVQPGQLGRRPSLDSVTRFDGVSLPVRIDDWEFLIEATRMLEGGVEIVYTWLNFQRDPLGGEEPPRWFLPVAGAIMSALRVGLAILDEDMLDPQQYRRVKMAADLVSGGSIALDPPPKLILLDPARLNAGVLAGLPPAGFTLSRSTSGIYLLASLMIQPS